MGLSTKLTTLLLELITVCKVSQCDLLEVLTLSAHVREG